MGDPPTKRQAPRSMQLFLAETIDVLVWPDRSHLGLQIVSEYRERVRGNWKDV